jgi:hypothetical protein
VLPSCATPLSSSQLSRCHRQTDHQSAHRTAGALPKQLLPMGYLSAAVSSGHRNGVTPLSTFVRRCWPSRHRHGAHRPGSGRAVGVGRHRGVLRRGSRPRALGRGRPASNPAVGPPGGLHSAARYYVPRAAWLLCHWAVR